MFLLHPNRTSVREFCFVDPCERRRGSLGEPRTIPSVDLELDPVRCIYGCSRILCNTEEIGWTSLPVLPRDICFIGKPNEKVYSLVCCPTPNSPTPPDPQGGTDPPSSFFPSPGCLFLHPPHPPSIEFGGRVTSGNHSGYQYLSHHASCIKRCTPSTSGVPAVYAFVPSFPTRAKSNLTTSPGLQPERCIGGGARTTFLVV